MANDYLSLLRPACLLSVKWHLAIERALLKVRNDALEAWSMIEMQRWHGQGAQLLSLGVSVLLALWLLVRPELISGLAFGWRLPMLCLGVWALGAGFYHGMGLAAAQGGWPRRLLGAPLCWVLLALLFVLLLLRNV